MDFRNTPFEEIISQYINATCALESFFDARNVARIPNVRLGKNDSKKWIPVSESARKNTYESVRILSVKKSFSSIIGRKMIKSEFLILEFPTNSSKSHVLCKNAFLIDVSRPEAFKIASIHDSRILAARSETGFGTFRSKRVNK